MITINDKKQRFSKQRKLIIDILKGRCDHPTAEMVYQSAREVSANISLGTVYRNLKLLADNGEIISLETGSDRLHYDGDTSNHSHFVCTNCGEIIDIFEKVAPPKSLKKLGVKIESERCIYFGKCQNCK